MSPSSWREDHVFPSVVLKWPFKTHGFSSKNRACDKSHSCILFQQTTVINVSFKCVSGPDVCHENLVSGPRGVADSQITSSSTYSNSSSANYAPYRGRLYSPSLNYQNGTFLNGGWSAKVNDRYQYIQVCGLDDRLSPMPFLYYICNRVIYEGSWFGY